MEELEEVLKTNLNNNTLLAPVDILALLITAVKADLLAVLPGDLLTLLYRIGATHLNICGFRKRKICFCSSLVKKLFFLKSSQ